MSNNYKLLFILAVLLVLCCNTSFAAFTVNVTGNPAFDSDGNTITTNVSGIGGTNASKTCGAGICTYNINGTFATGYGGVSDANYSILYSQDDISAVGNVTLGYVNSTGSYIPVCTDTNILLPTSPTSFSCNMTSFITSPITYLYTDITGTVVSATYTYDYAGVEITADSTAITSLPYTISNPGDYILDSDLTNGTPTAITVTANDVSLDCQGHSLTGLYTNSTQGVVQSNTNNFTLKNCFVSEYGVNFLSTGGNNTIIQNNTFDNASQSGVQACTSFQCTNWSVTLNTVQDSFNNGWEQFGCFDNCLFDNNTFKGQLLGHGTDRGFQFVSNINNAVFTHNYITNNTFAFRADNVNYTNILVAHNNFSMNLNGLNEQVQSGTYSNVTYLNNTIESTTGADYTWAGISTTTTFCAETFVINNTASGGYPYLWFNQSNSGQTISNLNIGSFGVCDADNLVMTNITTNSPMGNVRNEFMQANNEVLDGLVCNGANICLRGLAVNDSSFSNIYSVGGSLSAINFLGGSANRNNVTNWTVVNATGGLLGAAIGGNNNTFMNGVVANSTPTAGAIGFQSATVGTGNLYQNVSLYNVPIGIIFTMSSGNTFDGIYIENTTTGILVNSSASGTKTVTMTNITLANQSGSNPASFDLFDTISPNELYVINWAIDPGGMNTSYQSFHNKYIHTDNNGATNVSFDQLNMTWSDSDLVGYNENQLSWWYYGGSWVRLIPTLDATANKFSYSAYTLSPGDKFTNALFFIDDCQVINASGVYYQHRNYFNATNPSAPYLDFNCIDIRVPDVTWDCQGFNITNDGTPSQNIGILAASNNITVQNCHVSLYDYGEYSTGNNLQVINNTFLGNGVGYSSFSSSTAQIHDNSFINGTYGLLFFFGTDNANVSTNLFSGNGLRDIDAGTTTGTVFDSNTHISGNVGISLLNSNNDNITNSNFTNYAFIPLQLVGADFTYVVGNFFTGNSYAIDMSGGADFDHILNNFINNTGFGAGISISQSTGNTVSFNNVTNGGQNGIFTDTSSFGNTISNNIVTGNTQIGIRVEGHDEIISSNIMNNNNQPGFASFNTYNLVVTNNTANGNSAGFRYLNTTTSNSSSNTAIANLADSGFNANGNGGLSSNILFTNDTAINNTGSGFQVDSDTNSITIINCVAQGSGGMFGAGITLAGTQGGVNGCTITGNAVTGIIVSGNNSLVQGNQISGNNPLNNDVGLGFTPGGITTYNANTASITGNNIFTNPTGIGNYVSTGISFSTNTIHANSDLGIVSIDSEITSTSDHLYNNNAADVFVNNTVPTTIAFITTQFDNPAGSLINYTTLSLSDSVIAGEAYSINYAGNVDPTSTGNLSVENATIELIDRATGMTVNSMIWSYNPGSLNSTSENSILAWTYDGTWAPRNSTVNTVANTVTLLNAGVSANYTLLYNPLAPPPPPPGPIVIGTGPSGGGNTIFVQQPDGSIIQYIQQPILNTVNNITSSIPLPNLTNISLPLPLVNVTVPPIYLPPTSELQAQVSIGQTLCGTGALLALVGLVMVYRFMKRLFNYALIITLMLLMLAAIIIYFRVI